MELETGCRGDLCCCHCRYQAQLRCHPWNEGFGKGRMTESVGWVCTVFCGGKDGGVAASGETQDLVIFNDRGHGACEMFREKEKNVTSKNN